MEGTNNNIDPKKRELSTEDMVGGIGRKTTAEELFDYLSKDGGTPISLKVAFAKYLEVD